MLPSFKNMIEQAKRMQEEMRRQLEELRIEATSGGGMVSVRVNGQKQVLELKIDPELVKGGDVEMIQDLVLAALNEANRQVEERFKEKLGALAGQLPPGIV